ncbi:uncharacterized protein LOC136074469 [Hydra vulgaris]|uniref:Uncharacterized protein LOC136074469 n=1 Tax=Hydra vulgaris TaxID=6087 RepID=A0ABM4B264_HYDVU
MGKAKDVSPSKKREVGALLKNTSYSQRCIASMTKISVTTVNRINKNLDKNADYTPQRTGHCGRKRLTTPRDDRKIRDICLENRNKPRRILTTLIQDAGIPVSPMTVRHRLKEQGFRCCRPAKKPKLTLAMQQKRLAWAKSHRHLTVDDWKNVSTSFIIVHIPFRDLPTLKL